MGYNRITTGKAIVGRNRLVQAGYGTIARTDTAAKNLFKLPGKSLILGIFIFGAAVSNAGTTANISIGKTGTNGYFLNAFDVKAATGAGPQMPAAAANLGDQLFASNQVVGIYAETGGASTLGGPWYVYVLYLASQ